MSPEELAAVLEKIPDEDVIYVVFSWGDEFALKRCWVEDESIYNNRTTVLGSVVKKHKGDVRLHLPGTLLEFDAGDVMSVNSIPDERVIYAKST